MTVRVGRRSGGQASASTTEVAPDPSRRGASMVTGPRYLGRSCDVCCVFAIWERSGAVCSAAIGMTRFGGRYSLLDLDPDLGRLLDRERRHAARKAMVARVIARPIGVWDVSRLGGVSPLNVGLLVLEGVIARELTFEGTVSTELLGPGDLVRPWAIDDEASLMESATCLNALAPLRVAVIDEALATRQSAFPEVTAVLVDRLNARARRLAMMQAIAHLNRVDARVEAVLWLLAERWGRVSRDGIVVGLVLSHRALGQLVGARRPTVSTAVAKLARSGRITRRADGTWLLDPASRPALRAASDGAIRQRRHLMPVSAPTMDLADQVEHSDVVPLVSEDGLGDVWTAIEALYERSQVQSEDVDALRQEIVALRQRARMAASGTAARTRMRGPRSAVGV